MKGVYQPVMRIHLLALLLLMTLMGVFPIDVILPSFPSLADRFDVDVSHIAYSASGFALVVALSQLLIGPLSDRIGRKRLLMAGLTLATLGAVGCMLANRYTAFMFFRFVQGLGCGSFVLSQALVQDLYDGRQLNAVRIMLTTASGVFICLSPVAGVMLETSFGWQSSFFVFIMLNLVAFVLIIFIPLEHKVAGSRDPILHVYRKMLLDRAYMSLSLLSAVAFACHFSFVIAAPILLMGTLELSAHEFSLVFMCYGLSYVLGGVIAGWFNRMVNPLFQVGLGLLLVGFASCLLLLWQMTEGVTLAGLMVPMIVCTAGTTLVRPAATTQALSRHPRHAGAASALNTTLMFAVGGLASTLMAAMKTVTPMNLGFMFLAFCMLGWLLLQVLKHCQPTAVDHRTQRCASGRCQSRGNHNSLTTPPKTPKP